MTYGGIKHPVQRKAALVAPVTRLPLANKAAIHKFKLLAGVRWSLQPPRDSGVGKDETKLLSEGGHGYFKISHEAFPELSMNLKWCSDTLDRLIVEANVCSICKAFDEKLTSTSRNNRAWMTHLRMCLWTHATFPRKHESVAKANSVSN